MAAPLGLPLELPFIPFSFPVAAALLTGVALAFFPLPFPVSLEPALAVIRGGEEGKELWFRLYWI